MLTERERIRIHSQTKHEQLKERQLIFSLMRYTGKRVVAQRYRLITIWL
jgi:hypothetical protein